MTTRFTGYTLGELQTALDIIYQGGQSSVIALNRILTTEIDRRKKARRSQLTRKTRIVLNNGQDGSCTIGSFCRNNEVEFDELTEALASTGKFVLDAGSNGDPDEYTITLA